MKMIRMLSLLILGSVAALCSGCGSSSVPIPAYGGNPSTSLGVFNIQTSVPSPSSNTLDAWGEAEITGSVSGGYTPCDPSQDANCIVAMIPAWSNQTPGSTFGNGSGWISSIVTNSNGQAILYTDAASADWSFDASGGTGCSSNYGYLFYGGGITSSPQINITCGNLATSFVSTPSSCTIITNQSSGTSSSNCPAMVTLSVVPEAQSTISLPTSYALTEANFDNTGANLAQSNVTASSTTQISVPTPMTAGATYLVVYDPSNQQIIGYSPFIVRQVTVGTPPCTKNGECSD